LWYIERARENAFRVSCHLDMGRGTTSTGTGVVVGTRIEARRSLKGEERER
jgi:hypothetical protein